MGTTANATKLNKHIYINAEAMESTFVPQSDASGDEDPGDYSAAIVKSTAGRRPCVMMILIQACLLCICCRTPKPGRRVATLLQVHLKDDSSTASMVVTRGRKKFTIMSISCLWTC